MLAGSWPTAAAKMKAEYLGHLGHFRLLENAWAGWGDTGMLRLVCEPSWGDTWGKPAKWLESEWGDTGSVIDAMKAKYLKFS